MLETACECRHPHLCGAKVVSYKKTNLDIIIETWYGLKLFPQLI